MRFFANQNSRSNSNNNSSPRSQQWSKIARNLARTCQTLSKTITPASDRLEPRGAAVLPPGGLHSNFTSRMSIPVKIYFKVSTFYTFQVDNLIVAAVTRALYNGKKKGFRSCYRPDPEVYPKTMFLELTDLGWSKRNWPLALPWQDFQDGSHSGTSNLPK